MVEHPDVRRMVKKRVRRAAAAGDTESLFLDPSFVEANLPDVGGREVRRIARKASAAEEQKQLVEEVVAWFAAEIDAMKAAEANMNWRYTKARMDLDDLKPKLKREFTDKRTGAVAWEAFERALLCPKCDAYVRCKFFSIGKYRLASGLRDGSWENQMRTSATRLI